MARMILERELLTAEQITGALAHSREHDILLGDALRELGLLDDPQINSIRKSILAQFQHPGWMASALRESELGRLACYRRLLSEEELQEALREQALQAAEGFDLLLGQLLVERKLLTHHQLIRTLLYESLFCERCQTLFKVNGYEPGMRVKCTTCPVMLKTPPHDLRLISGSRDLFIDSRGIEDRMHYSQLAVRHGFCTQAQVKEANDRWARSLGDRSLGDVLAELGYLNASQDQELQGHLKRERDRHDELFKHEVAGMQFGKIAVHMGLITAPMLQSVLVAQQKQPGRWLAQMLYEDGYITLGQAVRILELQDKAILACPNCAKKYTVSLKARGLFPPCPDCKTRLERPGLMINNLDVERELTPAR